MNEKIESAFIPSPLRATSPYRGGGGGRDLIPHLKRRWRCQAVLVKTRFGWRCSIPRAGKPPFELWNLAISTWGRTFSGSIFRLSASLSQLTTAQTFSRASPPPEIDSRFELVKPFAFHPLPTYHRLKLNTGHMDLNDFCYRPIWFNHAKEGNKSGAESLKVVFAPWFGQGSKLRRKYMNITGL